MAPNADAEVAERTGFPGSGARRKSLPRAFVYRHAARSEEASAEVAWAGRASSPAQIHLLPEPSI
jgi:hypothetical protein